jgi:hypothetical protein
MHRKRFTAKISGEILGIQIIMFSLTIKTIGRKEKELFPQSISIYSTLFIGQF